MTNTNTSFNPIRNLTATVARLESELGRGRGTTWTLNDPDFDAELAEIAEEISAIEAKLDAQEEAWEMEYEGSVEEGPVDGEDEDEDEDDCCPLCGGSNTTTNAKLMTCRNCGAVTHFEDTYTTLVDLVAEAAGIAEEITTIDLDTAPNVAKTLDTLLNSNSWEFVNCTAISYELEDTMTVKGIREMLKNLGGYAPSKAHKGQLAFSLAMELAAVAVAANQ